MTLLDIGGGFPGINNAKISFEETTKVINESLDEHFPNDDIKIIAEPGRYFVEASHTLVLNVIGKKQVIQNGEKTFQYFMNEGVYASFNCIFFDHAKPIIHEFNQRKGEKFKTIFFGPTCDSVDQINHDPIMLPELTIGEVCYVENFGSYTQSGTTFNGFTPTESKYILTH